MHQSSGSSHHPQNPPSPGSLTSIPPPQPQSYQQQPLQRQQQQPPILMGHYIPSGQAPSAPSISTQQFNPSTNHLAASSFVPPRPIVVPPHSTIMAPSAAQSSITLSSRSYTAQSSQQSGNLQQTSIAYQSPVVNNVGVILSPNQVQTKCGLSTLPISSSSQPSTIARAPNNPNPVFNHLSGTGTISHANTNGRLTTLGSPISANLIPSVPTIMNRVTPVGTTSSALRGQKITQQLQVPSISNTNPNLHPPSLHPQQSPIPMQVPSPALAHPHLLVGQGMSQGTGVYQQLVAVSPPPFSSSALQPLSRQHPSSTLTQLTQTKAQQPNQHVSQAQWPSLPPQPMIGQIYNGHSTIPATATTPYPTQLNQFNSAIFVQNQHFDGQFATQASQRLSNHSPPTQNFLALNEPHFDQFEPSAHHSLPNQHHIYLTQQNQPIIVAAGPHPTNFVLEQDLIPHHSHNSNAQCSHQVYPGRQQGLSQIQPMGYPLQTQNVDGSLLPQDQLSFVHHQLRHYHFNSFNGEQPSMYQPHLQAQIVQQSQSQQQLQSIPQTFQIVSTQQSSQSSLPLMHCSPIDQNAFMSQSLETHQLSPPSIPQHHQPLLTRLDSQPQVFQTVSSHDVNSDNNQLLNSPSESKAKPLPKPFKGIKSPNFLGSANRKKPAPPKPSPDKPRFIPMVECLRTSLPTIDVDKSIEALYIAFNESIHLELLHNHLNNTKPLTLHEQVALFGKEILPWTPAEMGLQQLGMNTPIFSPDVSPFYHSSVLRMPESPSTPRSVTPGLERIVLEEFNYGIYCHLVSFISIYSHIVFSFQFNSLPQFAETFEKHREDCWERTEKQILEDCGTWSKSSRVPVSDLHLLPAPSHSLPIQHIFDNAHYYINQHQHGGEGSVMSDQWERTGVEMQENDLGWTAPGDFSQPAILTPLLSTHNHNLSSTHSSDTVSKPYISPEMGCTNVSGMGDNGSRDGKMPLRTTETHPKIDMKLPDLTKPITAGQYHLARWYLSFNGQDNQPANMLEWIRRDVSQRYGAHPIHQDDGRIAALTPLEIMAFLGPIPLRGQYLMVYRIGAMFYSHEKHSELLRKFVPLFDFALFLTQRSLTSASEVGDDECNGPVELEPYPGVLGVGIDGYDGPIGGGDADESTHAPPFLSQSRQDISKNGPISSKFLRGGFTPAKAMGPAMNAMGLDFEEGLGPNQDGQVCDQNEPSCSPGTCESFCQPIQPNAKKPTKTQVNAALAKFSSTGFYSLAPSQQDMEEQLQLNLNTKYDFLKRITAINPHGFTIAQLTDINSQSKIETRFNRSKKCFKDRLCTKSSQDAFKTTINLWVKLKTLEMTETSITQATHVLMRPDECFNGSSLPSKSVTRSNNASGIHVELKSNFYTSIHSIKADGVAMNILALGDKQPAVPSGSTSHNNNTNINNNNNNNMVNNSSHTSIVPSPSSFSTTTSATAPSTNQSSGDPSESTLTDDPNALIDFDFSDPINQFVCFITGAHKNQSAKLIFVLDLVKVLLASYTHYKTKYFPIPTAQRTIDISWFFSRIPLAHQTKLDLLNEIGLETLNLEPTPYRRNGTIIDVPSQISLPCCPPTVGLPRKLFSDWDRFYSNLQSPSNQQSQQQDEAPSKIQSAPASKIAFQKASSKDTTTTKTSPLLPPHHSAAAAAGFTIHHQPFPSHSSDQRQVTMDTTPNVNKRKLDCLLPDPHSQVCGDFPSAVNDLTPALFQPLKRNVPLNHYSGSSTQSQPQSQSQPQLQPQPHQPSDQQQ